jgi:Circularly permutated YpsA SLOG family
MQAAWFGSLDPPRCLTTHQATPTHGRSILDVVDRVDPSEVVARLSTNGFRSLNVAGNRESSNPGIGEWVERFLMAVFRRIECRHSHEDCSTSFGESLQP